MKIHEYLKFDNFLFTFKDIILKKFLRIFWNSFHFFPNFLNFLIIFINLDTENI